ncbi:MAG: hypothetical protein BWY27_00770 [Bacteroidetes bacterium ADurb.Bin234]|nr:MAG: hypothetical protein BWY27_00770 [Bacteroidetes bacterium ADurb.Bin234]
MNKQKIICDTLIWYNIANGNIKKEELKDLYLIGTAVNIAEIARSSHLNKDKINLLQEVIDALTNYHDIIYVSNPYDHIISIFYPSFEPNNNYTNNMLNDFEKVLQIRDFDNIDWEEINKHRQYLNNKRQEYSDIVNEILMVSREHIKFNHLKKKHKNCNFKDTWKSFIIKIIANYSKREYNHEFIIKEDDIRWSRLDFFLSVWDEYFKCLDIETNRKFHNNDWEDLFNLVYVQPGFKYSTRENKFLEIIKNNRDISNYLYEFNFY